MIDIAGKRVFITGAGGFIGSHLTRLLVEQGAKVTAGVYPDERNIADLRGKLDVAFMDLRDRDQTLDLVKQFRPQIIFHLAALLNVRRDLSLADEIFEHNVDASIHLIQACADVGFERFVQTGTCEEYGDNPTPFTEDQLPNPVSPYSASKLAMTHFCTMLHKTQGLPMTVVRPFLTYGPGQRARMLITDIIRAGLHKTELKLTACEQTREFNYVTDIARGFLLAGTSEGVEGEIINIGCGEEVTLRHFVEKVLELMGNPVEPEFGALPYRPGETMHFYCSNEKAKRVLGYEPQVSLEEGLARTVEWYRNNPDVLKAAAA